VRLSLSPVCRALPVVVVLACGCRTAGPQVKLRDCRGCTVSVPGAIEAHQGKSVPVDVLRDPTVSASQNGDATAVRAGEGE
jgi:hypothetical protein